MKLSYSKISVKDLAALAQRVIETAKASEIEEVKTHLFLSKLESVYNEYYSTISKQSTSGKGKSVAQADKQRGKIFSDMKLFLEGYIRIPSMPHHNDAVALHNDFKSWGASINKLSYAEQTIQLSKLIDALSVQEQQERIKNIGLNITFHQLKTSNQEFKEVYDEQAEINSKLKGTPSATIKRKDLQKALKRFIDLVTLMHESNQWTPLYLKLNEFAKAVN